MGSHQNSCTAVYKSWGNKLWFVAVHYVRKRSGWWSQPFHVKVCVLYVIKDTYTHTDMYTHTHILIQTHSQSHTQSHKHTRIPLSLSKKSMQIDREIEIISLYWVVQRSWFARVNALCNLSHKKSQKVVAATSRPIYRGRWQRMKKNMSSHHFWADQKIVSSWKKCIFWHPISWATIYCLLPGTFWLWAFKNALKVGTVNFANSLSLPSIVKKVHTGSKNSQGT